MWFKFVFCLFSELYYGFDVILWLNNFDLVVFLLDSDVLSFKIIEGLSEVGKDVFFVVVVRNIFFVFFVLGFCFVEEKIVMLDIVEIVVVIVFWVNGVLRFFCYGDYDMSWLYDLMYNLLGKENESFLRVVVEEYCVYFIFNLSDFEERSYFLNFLGKMVIGFSLLRDFII